MSRPPRPLGRAIAGVLAVGLAGAAQAADAGVDAAVAELLARHHVLAAADPGRLAALRAFAAQRRAAEPAPPPAAPSVDEGRVWPTAGARRLAAHGAPPALRWRTAPSAAVRVPAAGRIVFADRVDGLGLVLITAHGHEYHSVLAGLEALAVTAGAEVRAGERIGRMAERAAAGLELQFELRHHGRPVDPRPWLGVATAGDGSS